VATVVVAAKGYPGSYGKGFPISGTADVEDDRRVVFHAGTSSTDKGLVTSGGRVLAVTAWGSDLNGAIRHAYEGVKGINFEGAYHRTDIGHRAL
jgi:phosphoribosylamine-glycine ligase